MGIDHDPGRAGSMGMGDLVGDTALVTGGARGIGLAIATRLVAEGAKVVLLDIDAEAGSRAAAQVGGRSYTVDITDPVKVASTVAEIRHEVGAVTILVNNAGVAGRSAPLWQLELAEWDQVLAINLSAAFYCCRAVIPHMRTTGYGRIVNIASIAGKEGNPNAVPYSASKAGLIGLTKALAKELVFDGVLVNCVTPAVIETDILKQVSEEHKQYMLSRIPMGRAGRPEEVGELVAWLCSRRCSFSTGAVFDISGGRASY